MGGGPPTICDGGVRFGPGPLEVLNGRTLGEGDTRIETE